MSAQKTEEVTNRIFTIPNVISFIRLCMVPVYMVLLLNGYDLLATFMFALAAGTDWIDGQLARRTHCVSKLGQLLDPAVDRILMSCGVIGLMLVGRLPIWIVVVVLGRDLMLLIGGAYLLKRYHERVAVIYPGKVATTFLFVGFAGLLLNMPLLGGLGWFDASWLPGFGSEACSWGIWFVYAGLVLGLFTTLYYLLAGYRKMQKARRLEAKGRAR
ncbi:CDP-alcohol phosphatidyltransferase family protein [uncultured Senegalimassilia sp.]|uniref:CDP-alcohol phosphatidyltransferase family protein n=1 Tax=uncultured Senegalimassilia sp. TaxID=1714350 RepID=UPI0025D9D613|nr:CDP-alcohol phosphatidyltransferase family protein [uncultured Senegalimassilia sp.]